MHVYLPVPIKHHVNEYTSSYSLTGMLANESVVLATFPCIHLGLLCSGTMYARVPCEVLDTCTMYQVLHSSAPRAAVG